MKRYKLEALHGIRLFCILLTGTNGPMVVPSWIKDALRKNQTWSNPCEKHYDREAKMQVLIILTSLLLWQLMK
jgi:hypothetical protein